ncbi:hypothetical protein [Kineosporia babensis]|uniref:Uncharacterized protein n=1 Tax=Kineosporia babensis TaxID=499548 RepID=A0A9X1NBQ9_9ACTN|nr:hypothetical protein [Kineosporia babensis]MCD5310904.1 hypothetical protein [Kineosporia babensis]
MTETLAGLPGLEWYPEDGTMPLGEGTPGGTVMDAEQAASTIAGWKHVRRTARVIDAFTVEAATPSGEKSLWLARLPEQADRHRAVKVVLDRWADAPLTVVQHRLLGIVLRAHADGLDVRQILDRLIATGVEQ